MGEKAIGLGGDTFAFFTRNPRGGAAKEIDPADADALRELMEELYDECLRGKGERPVVFAGSVCG